MFKAQFANKQFISFIVVGGFAALVNFSARLLASEFMSYRWAVLVAYVFGMLTAFILSKYFVFAKSGRNPIQELYYFAIVNLVAAVLVWVISVTLAEYLFPKIDFTFYPEEIAHIIGLSAPVFTSFLGHKYFSFKPKVEKS